MINSDINAKNHPTVQQYLAKLDIEKGVCHKGGHREVGPVLMSGFFRWHGLNYLRLLLYFLRINEKQHVTKMFTKFKEKRSSSFPVRVGQMELLANPLPTA